MSHKMYWNGGVGKPKSEEPVSKSYLQEDLVREQVVSRPYYMVKAVISPRMEANMQPVSTICAFAFQNTLRLWNTQAGAEFAACLLCQELSGELVLVVREGEEPGSVQNDVALPRGGRPGGTDQGVQRMVDEVIKMLKDELEKIDAIAKNLSGDKDVALACMQERVKVLGLLAGMSQMGA